MSSQAKSAIKQLVLDPRNTLEDQLAIVLKRHGLFNQSRLVARKVAGSPYRRRGGGGCDETGTHPRGYGPGRQGRSEDTR